MADLVSPPSPIPAFTLNEGLDVPRSFYGQVGKDADFTNFDQRWAWVTYTLQQWDIVVQGDPELAKKMVQNALDKLNGK